MRITLTGASGVGKTALAQALAEKLKLPLIPEIARELCLASGWQKIGDIKDQEGFKHTVLQEQIAREEKLGQFIADRSAFDAWVLWQRWNLCSAMTYDSERLYNLAREQSQKYTHVIYIPPLIELKEDSFRWTDIDYQKQVDRITRMTLYDFDLWPVTQTIKSSVFEERIQEVVNWIDNHR